MGGWFPGAVLLLVVAVSVVHCDTTHHGLIREDERIVELKPKIIAERGTCGFHLLPAHRGEEVPFEIRITSEGTGETEVRAKRLLNCEKKKNYRFDFSPVQCSRGGGGGENSTLYITVVDVNEYSPVFLEPSYVKEVDEGHTANILRVEATDRDCTSKYGDICKYEILGDGGPFAIDENGVISNTERLSYEKQHNWILEVVAYDCGLRRSQPVLVNIKVNRVCQLGWWGIPERIDYSPKPNRQLLFPSAHLQLCDLPCDVKQISTTVQLRTDYIGKGCDRDTYNVNSQRKLCGSPTPSTDLLPSTPTPWLKDIPLDEGRESDAIYEFDGQSTVVIPKNVIPFESLDLTKNWTVSTWMKHQGDGGDKHRKEHLLCFADDHKMNRHHFALFVRNCHLILLIRREHVAGELNTFRPAEWRWRVGQLCSPSPSWTHYTLTISYPTIQLYVNGEPFPQSLPSKTFEIIDDWPLHFIANLTTVKTIGSCWQATEAKFKHYFKGYLSGLNLLEGTEAEETVRCLYKCKEKLDVENLDRVLRAGEEFIINSEQTEITIESSNSTDVESILRQIHYTNTREFPTPGRRNLHISSRVTCTSAKQIKIIPTDTFVMVLPSQLPLINLNGTRNVMRDYEDFRFGVRVFSDVRIGMEQSGGGGEEWDEPPTAMERKLDSCVVTIYPPINPDHEVVSIPENMAQAFGISQRVTPDGVLLGGADMIYNYEQVLRQIQYINRKPAYYLNRSFKLVCSELNGRFTSNEYTQTLTVIHPDTSTTTRPPTKQQVEVVANAMIHRDEVEMRAERVVGVEEENRGPPTPPAHAVTVIVVVCLGFLLFMVALGVVRIRAAQQRAQQEVQDAELAWDDSALNITVNPMETLPHNPHPPSNPPHPNHDSSESEYDSSSSGDDEEDPPRQRELDWDPSI